MWSCWVRFDAGKCVVDSRALSVHSRFGCKWKGSEDGWKEKSDEQPKPCRALALVLCPLTLYHLIATFAGYSTPHHGGQVDTASQRSCTILAHVPIFPRTCTVAPRVCHPSRLAPQRGCQHPTNLIAIILSLLCIYLTHNAAHSS